MLGLNKNLTFAVILAVLIILTIIVIQFFPIPEGTLLLSGKVNEQEKDKKVAQSLNPAQTIEKVILSILKTDSPVKALDKFNMMKQSGKSEFIESFLSLIDTELLKSLLSGDLKKLPASHRKFITQVLAEISGLPPNTILYRAKPDSLSAIFGIKAISGNSPVTISFTASIGINPVRNAAGNENESVQPFITGHLNASNGVNNSPQSAKESFSPSETQIYACFPNGAGLKELRYVKVKWMRLSPDKIIYEGYKLIDPGKPYNFVWVRNTQGWEKGKYEVSIFNLAENCLAKGVYEIK